MKIAVLGLGRMGQALTPHLLAAGHEVTVFNRTADAASAPELAAATVAGTPVEAVAGAEAVISVLFGPDAVREVITGGALNFAPGALWIDVTTVSPADAREFAAWSSAEGVRYVHSPVLGSLAPARAGALGVLMGGSVEAVEAAARITSLWADPSRIHRFDSAPQAAAAKLLVNLGLAVATQGLAEAIQLGRSNDLSLDQILAVLDKTPLAGVIAAKADTLRSNSFAEGQFTVDALAKDAALAAAATPLALPALRAAAEALARQHDAGRGEWDFLVITSRSYSADRPSTGASLSSSVDADHKFRHGPVPLLPGMGVG